MPYPRTLRFGAHKQTKIVSRSYHPQVFLRDTLITKMIKSLFAAGAAISLSAGAAVAGPYVEVETNAGWVGDDYTAATTDLHVGYEGDLGESASFYVQGGPALVAIDGEDTETEFSGKAGVGVEVTEQLGIYGEVSFLTDGDDAEDTNYGTKFGVRYTF